MWGVSAATRLAFRLQVILCGHPRHIRGHISFQEADFFVLLYIFNE
jgi:hypothetical protein